MKIVFYISLMVSLSFMGHLNGQVDARLFQHPDISETQIAFAYGGDIWTLDKSGGLATRLTTAKGNETFPKFSPDGTQIAFSANYDGNTDVYVMPSGGGVPKRLTFHGMNDRLIDWHPNGQDVIFANSSESGKQRFSQFYKVSIQGGLPEKLPIAYGEFGSMSPDGNQMAFTDRSRVFRTWKRYRGGSAADVWIFNLKTMESTNISQSDENDELPMWVGDQIYYLSDRGSNARFNIWSYDIRTKASRQVTNHTRYDVHFPSYGGTQIIYEVGGDLHVLDVSSGKTREVPVQITSDMISIKPKKESVEDYIQHMTISPDGARALVQARGDVFSLPAEKGIVKNLTRTAGVAERSPAWSPNGRYIAYWSDLSGEYELMIRDLKEGAREEQISQLGAGFRYQIYWSPDSKKLTYVDQTMTIWVYDIEGREASRVDQDISLFEGGLRGWRPDWSPDSKWLAYSKTLSNGNGAIFMYNVESRQVTQATSGFYADLGPVFDPDGKYLYLLTNRTFSPIYSDFDNTWTYPNATSIGLITLRKDIDSPLAPENDTVAVVLKETKTDSTSITEAKTPEKEEDNKDVSIDFDGFERRLVMLPPNPGNIGSIGAVSGKVLFLRFSNSGSAESKTHLMYFDLKEKEEKTIIQDINGYVLSANGKKVLIRKNGQAGIIEVGADQKMDKMLVLKEMEMVVDPRQEWQQIFNDSWRFQRDYFYDQEMHGLNWAALKDQYGSMIQDAMDRNDVNFILGELIGELNASHTYRGGGDQENADMVSVGYLGIDWAFSNGHYQVGRIIRGADWDIEVRSPLDAPGVNVNEGDFILAVNGIAMEEFASPWEAFAGLSGKTVELTVNSTPSWENARSEIITTLSSETRLRNLAWIEQNRKRVDEASDGTIGYIYVPSTGVDGQNELVRQFYGQWDKEGLIVDERFNNGGQIPDRFIELLNRKPLAYWDVRDGQNWQWPPVAHFGSMAMLINGWAGSGGDAFPDYFKKAGLGPLIGGRTWGGLIGISGAPQLIDGGVVTVPTFRMYNPDGTWFKEGHGVDPDIEVPEDPSLLAQGIDNQLERAIEEVLKSIERRGPIHPKVPPRENRTKEIKP